jgi:hypothetical protein
VVVFSRKLFYELSNLDKVRIAIDLWNEISEVFAGERDII